MIAYSYDSVNSRPRVFFIQRGHMFTLLLRFETREKCSSLGLLTIEHEISLWSLFLFFPSFSHCLSLSHSLSSIDHREQCAHVLERVSSSATHQFSQFLPICAVFVLRYVDILPYTVAFAESSTRVRLVSGQGNTCFVEITL